MGLFNFFLKKLTKQPTQTEQDTVSAKIDYGKHTEPTTKVQTPNETYKYSSNTKYVCISTSGDKNVCPMCAQFEGKFFLSTDAPKLPLCPSCACAYEYYFDEDLPPNTAISHKNDFTLPAECTSIFYKHQQNLYSETDIKKQIRLCEQDIKKLSEFMAPYISSDFPAPRELVCRDLLPELYMQLGEWEKAERVINKCIDARAYSPNDGSKELADLASYQKTAIEALSYIEQNPGCLQRNIYKALPYEGDEREQLKHFLRYSRQIKKIKHGNTNELYCDEYSIPQK